MSDARKRKRNYYIKSSKKKKYNDLDAGMKGFLLTCNNKEKGTVREAYNLFNEYADKLYGECKPEGEAQGESEGGSSEEDIAASLQKEIDEIKSTKPNKWRFKNVTSGANNCVFISTTISDPNELIDDLFLDALNSGVSKTRYILRMLPILGTCRTDEQNIEKLASDIMPEFFEKNIAVSFKIEVKIRNNNVSRNMLFKSIGKVIQELNPNNHVSLHKPDYIVSVDVLRTVCCIGVLANFEKFKKYNIQEAAKVGQSSKAEAGNPDPVAVVEDRENTNTDPVAVVEDRENTNTDPVAVVEDRENTNTDEDVISKSSDPINGSGDSEVVVEENEDIKMDEVKNADVPSKENAEENASDPVQPEVEISGDDQK